MANQNWMACSVPGDKHKLSSRTTHIHMIINHMHHETTLDNSFRERQLITADLVSHCDQLRLLEIAADPNDRLKEFLWEPYPRRASMELLVPRHVLAGFDSGDEWFNDWLTQRARSSYTTGESRTYGITGQGRMVAYYSLFFSSIIVAPSEAQLVDFAKPMAIMTLGPLAVDQAYQARGWGRSLVRDALQLVADAGGHCGWAGVAFQALNPKAEAFYRSVGFRQSPIAEQTLFVSLSELQANR